MEEKEFLARMSEVLGQEDKEAKKKMASLQDIAHEGALFSDWANTFCTRQLFKWLDEQIQDTKNTWISAESREAAEAIRLQAQSYTKIKNWIVSKINAGQYAANGLKQFHDQGVEIEGLIKLPPPTE